jgi:hypothetical protein
MTTNNFSQDAWQAFYNEPDFQATALYEKMHKSVESENLDTILPEPTFQFVNVYEELSRKCPTCGKICSDKYDIEEIDENGECLMCEKERGELNNYEENE